MIGNKQFTIGKLDNCILLLVKVRDYVFILVSRIGFYMKKGLTSSLVNPLDG